MSRLDDIAERCEKALERCYPGDDSALHVIAREDIPWLLERIKVAEAKCVLLEAHLWHLVPKHEEPTSERYAPPPDVADDKEWELLRYPNLETHEFNGTTYRIFINKEDPNTSGGYGYCQPKVADPLLWLWDGLEGPHLIQVATHEGIHAALPQLGEAEVDRVARDVSAFVLRLVLWKSGKLMSSERPSLDTEVATYKRELPRLLNSEGKYVLIRGDQVIDVFDSYADAVKFGYATFGVGKPFLVKQIQAVERVQFFTREVGS